MSIKSTQAQKATEAAQSDNKPTTTTTSTASSTVDRRDRRALEECMRVVPYHGKAKDADGMYAVFGENQRSPKGTDDGYYLVAADLGTCTCGDHEYDGNTCKHIRRVQFMSGRRLISPAIQNTVTADHGIGGCMNTEKEFLMPNGDTITVTDTDTDTDTEGDDQ